MDGLECSEIMLSTVESSNSSIRLDSHFYEKKYMKLKSELYSIPHWHLKDIVSKQIQTGHTPSMANQAYYGGNINFIKTDNLRHNRIAGPFADTLSESGNAVIARTSLQPLDIITTIIGATEEVIARTALVTQEDLPANINQNIVQIRINPEIASPEYISIFLNTDYGRNYMCYLSRQTEQVNLNCAEVENIMIPKFSTAFQSSIEKLVQSAYELKRQSMERYEGAEALLLSALNYQPIMQAQSYLEKSFSASFGVTGRLDAEYYQPKYDELSASLHTNDTVCSLCVLHDQNFMPNEKRKYTYIELADVGQMGEISGADPVFGADLPTRARRKVEAGSVIISSIEGSLQSCALITDEFNGALCSTGFYVLTSESLNPETLLVLFKSEPIQMLMKQRCSGTILTAISKDELLSMPLPKIDDEVQEVIAEKVQESFSLRRQSTQLLENAKHTVEIAIEQGEVQAMRWLQE